MIQLKKVKSMEHLGYLLTHNNNIIDNDNDNIIVINKKKSTNNNTYIKHNLTHQSRLHSKSTSNISYQPISLSKSPTKESNEIQTFKFNYIDIVHGRIPAHLLDLKNIENQLNDEDYLEYLGIPPSQLEILSSVDIYLRKRRAFLLPKQIISHIVNKK